jgi:trigger factor
LKTQVEEVSKNKVKLTVLVPTADVEKVLGDTYRRLAAEVRVPGFRPGKAPRAVIDQRLGKDFVRSEVLKDILPPLYAEALKETDLDVVAPPSIDVKSFEEGEDLTFEAVVETRPDAILKKYDGLKVTKPPVEVTDADVDDQVERMRTRFASLEAIERPLQSGDYAQIDLTTYRHDQTIEDLSFKDVMVELGAEMFVPELDAELIGKRRGDILKITSTLPERFGEHAGQQVGMTILVKETKTRKLPALDDELAKTSSEFDTLEELKADIRVRLGEMHESQAQNKLREHVLDAFVDEGVEVELPEGMVELEIDDLLTSLVQLLAAQGVGVRQYLEANNLEPEGLRDQFRDQAQRNLAMRLGLDAVAKAEDLRVTEDERSEAVEHLASRTKRTPEDVRGSIEAMGSAKGAEGEAWKSVDGDILRSKALDLLVERADVTVKEDPSPDATESEPRDPGQAGSAEEES